MLRYARLALSLLTIAPVAPRGEMREGEFARAAAFYPLIGALVGLVGWAVDSACGARVPELVRGLLVVASWAVVTRGLHLDGLADTVDGLATLGGREKALSVMRDPRIGALGAAALVIVVATQAASIAGLPGAASSRGGALVAAAVASRLAMTLSAWLLPSARETGLGALVIGRVRMPVTLAACALAAACAFAAGRESALATLAVGCGAGLVASGVAALKLRGATGDTLGASGEIAQTAALVWASSAWAQGAS